MCSTCSDPYLEFNSFIYISILSIAFVLHNLLISIVIYNEVNTSHQLVNLYFRSVNSTLCKLTATSRGIITIRAYIAFESDKVALFSHQRKQSSISNRRTKDPARIGIRFVRYVNKVICCVSKHTRGTQPRRRLAWTKLSEACQRILEREKLVIVL